MLFWFVLACGGAPEPQPETIEPIIRQVALPSPIGPGTARHTPQPIALTSEHAGIAKELDTLVRAHTRDPQNPWAIAHGLVALGADLTLQNDQPAVEWLFETYAERVETQAGWVLRFPESVGDTRVEPHPDLILKALADAGVDPDRMVKVQGESHVVGDLFRGSLAETHFEKRTGQSSFKTPNDLAWTLMGLASWSEAGTEWTTPSLQTTTIDDLTDHAWLKLSSATSFLAKAKKTKAGFQKRGQGIFAFTCGGAHMIQGVNHAKLKGFGHPSLDGPIKVQMELLTYRYPIELAQIDAALVEHPKYAAALLIQRLKLTGHTLETLARLSASGHADAPTTASLAPYVDAVVETVKRLRESGLFGQANQLKTKDYQRYLDLVGDSAHALRGLRIATGESPVFY